MKIPCAFFLFCLLVSCSASKTAPDPLKDGKHTSLRVKGSETMRPIMDELIPRFSENHALDISYDGIGSNAGIQALSMNTADLILLSRAPSNQEMEQLERNGEVELQEIAYDGITVIVNRSNHVDALSMEQLKGIFSGKITNWGFAGFENTPITVFTRDVNSGTFVFFKNHVLDSLDYRIDAKPCTSNEEILLGVKHTEGAIGYVGLDFNDGDSKALSLSPDGGRTFYNNSRNNIRNHRYPLNRPLYLAYYKKNKALVAPLVDYIFSEKGQQIMNNVGFLSLDK